LLQEVEFFCQLLNFSAFLLFWSHTCRIYLLLSEFETNGLGVIFGMMDHVVPAGKISLAIFDQTLEWPDTGVDLLMSF
jgi:hypothetical protein